MDPISIQAEYLKMMEESDPHNDGRALNLISYDKSKGKSHFHCKASLPFTSQRGTHLVCCCAMIRNSLQASTSPRRHSSS